MLNIDQINLIIETVTTQLGKPSWQVDTTAFQPKLDALNTYIDHTALKADVCEADIRTLCAEAIEHKFKAVCVNPVWIPLVSTLLKGSGVETCTVIGFPLGANSSTVKIAEAGDVIVDGATEIDVVQNIAWIKDKKYEQVLEELSTISMVAKSEHVLTKVILETCYLSEEEIVVSCVLARLAEFDFVKTSTGFGTAGASSDLICLMRCSLSRSSIGIKASGGVSTNKAALDMLAAGANRIGTSKGVHLLKGS